MQRMQATVAQGGHSQPLGLFYWVLRAWGTRPSEHAEWLGAFGVLCMCSLDLFDDVQDDDLGITFYWEHCGMLSDPGYRNRWEEKRQWYIDHGILPHEKGGGPKGTLIVTEDRPDGGISSKDILTLVRTVIRREKS